LNKESKWIFHARIKTPGPAGIKNCHCWRDKQTGTIFAHNGTFDIAVDKDKTDSETYFRNVVVPLYQHRGQTAAIKAGRMIANRNSKIAIIFEKEQKQISLIGNWINRNGIYYSNSSAFTEYSFRCNSLLDDEFGEIDYSNRKSQSFGRKHLCTHNNNTAATTTQLPLPETRPSTVNKKPTLAAGHVSKSQGLAWGY
jgi:predicted glutamine amidotransferase